MSNRADHRRLLRYARLWLYDNGLSRQLDNFHQCLVILAKALYQIFKI